MKNELADGNLPAAKIRKQSRFSLVWLVPGIAAVVGGWLVFVHVWQNGPTITIQFENGSEMAANQTLVRYRGVRVGAVRSVRLTPDARHVEVQVQLERSAKSLAKEGSIFWIEHPGVGSEGLHGLDTIVSGPYIQVQPGDGPAQRNFVGSEEAPLNLSPEPGLEVVLTMPQLGALNVGSPVYYRGLEVGAVRYFMLSDNSTLVNVHALIKTNYAALVRTDTKFWNAGGINVNLKLFGVKISAESFKSLVIGGIAFATPTMPGSPATNGMVFPLNEKLDDKWLTWTPQIGVTNAQTQISPSEPSALLLNKMNPGETKSQPNGP